MTDFRIRVIVDPTGVPGGVRKVERSLALLSNRANLLRSNLRGMLAPIIGGAAIIGAVRSMAHFQDAITTAGAVANATAGQFDQLTERALDLGTTTRYSAKQAADSLTGLARAGFSVEESIDTVDDVLKLAVASNLSLATATDITASVLRGFSLETKEAARVTDVLVDTANRSNTNVQQLGEGMKFVAPVAAALGRSIEETSAALGVLSDAGLKATLAGTGLRRVFAELAAPGEDLTRLLGELGLTADQIDPKVNDLADIMAKLQVAGNDAGIALQIFGQRGGPAFLNLVRNIPKLRRLFDELNKGKGTTDRVANALNKTLAGALLRARNALDALVQRFGAAGASDAFITLLDSLATLLRLVAKHANTLVNILTALTVAVGVKLAASLAAAVNGMGFFTVATVTAEEAAASTAVAVRGLNIALLANPWALVGAAIATAVIYLKEYGNEAKKAQKIQEQAAQDQKDSYNKLGASISNAQRELNRLARIKERDGELTKSQSDRYDQLKAAIALTSTAIRKNSDEFRREKKVADSYAVTVENVIARLKRQGEALLVLSKEPEIQEKVRQEVERLLQAKQKVTTADRALIEAQVRANAALSDQREVLDSIKGPQERYARLLKGANADLAAGIINQKEYNVYVEQLRSSLSGLPANGISAEVSQNSLDRLKESVALLKVRAQRGEREAAAVALENQLRKENVTITEGLKETIRKVLADQEQYNADIKDGNKLVRDRQQAEERENRALDRIERQIKFQEALNEEQRRLNKLLAAGRINAQQFTEAMRDLNLQSLQASKDLEAGFSRAFIKLQIEAEDLATVGEKIIDVFANQATDALTTFATTGQFEFKEFARAIVQDLIKIIARLLIVQALSAVFAPSTGGLGQAAANGASNVYSLVSGQRAKGGTMQPNRAYLVGEHGPEIVRPGQTSAVVPNPGPAQKPQVNVQVVNVTDPSEIPRAINDGSADDAIINAIARNKDKVKSVTS